MSEIELDLSMDLPSVSQVLNDTALTDISQPGTQLQACLDEFGFSAMTAQEFMEAGIEALNNSLVQACRAGTAFWAAQEALKNTTALMSDSEELATAPVAVSNFKTWIEQSGLVERRVYECIKLAKYYSRLPDGQRKKMLAIGKKQALLLAKMPQEIIDSVAENGIDILDEAETMTYDQLRDLLKSSERSNKQLNAELEHRDALIDKLKARQPNWQFLPKTHVVREECLAYQAECEVAMNSLQALFEDCVNDDTETEKAMRIEQVWITAQVVAARSADLLGKLKAFGLELPESINSQHSLTDDEAERWLLDYPLVERKHFAAKAKREEQRPKGPGRPKADK